MKFVNKDAVVEKEIITRFIELIRLNKHVKLNKSNPTMAYNVREFLNKNNISSAQLLKTLESSMITAYFKIAFPIEIIENTQFTDFHWIDNQVVS
ncbi:hypothetical protein ACJ2A9_21590 [Anaerobacillus sp. MEB173]|uniref:hypothetical protein n=1 Tax=Anaerobacillus sp. MEB173 TaxID=3383345 RepID=UPI003F8E8977